MKTTDFECDHGTVERLNNDLMALTFHPHGGGSRMVTFSENEMVGLVALITAYARHVVDEYRRSVLESLGEGLLTELRDEIGGVSR